MPEYTRRLILEDRFWDKVNKTETCWLWTGSVGTHGYGGFRYDGKVKKAHRVSYEMTNGAIPNGLQVDHICRVRHCVNPDHLRTATNGQQRENIPSYKNNTSGYKGVRWDPRAKSWVAYAVKDRKTHYAGWHKKIEDAADAVRELRLRIFTHNEADR